MVPSTFLYMCHDLRGAHYYYVIRCPFASLRVIYDGWGSDSESTLLLLNVHPLTPFDLLGVVINMRGMHAHPSREVFMATAIWNTEMQFL